MVLVRAKVRLADDLSVLLDELLALLEAAAAHAAVEARDVDHLGVHLDERLVGKDVEAAHAAPGSVLPVTEWRPIKKTSDLDDDFISIFGAI